MDNDRSVERTVETIDWDTWEPTERAVLCFVFDGDRVLLIHKKTGLGKGKVNAPGGRIEIGETPLQAAVRETQEEVGLTPWELTEVGCLFFEFLDGYKLHGTVFFARSFEGIPAKTREADPFWCCTDSLPYEQMWEDDRHWLPHALAGKRIDGYFVFDDDRMLSKRVGVSTRQSR